MTDEPRHGQEPQADAAWRFLRGAFGLIGRLALGFRLELVGAEHLPRDAAGGLIGGWIAAGVPHVTWIEPFVMLVLLPPELRLTWFGDARVRERSAWRRVIMPRLGRVVPIRPGGGPEAFARHVEAVRSVTDGGGVFAFFPERGPVAPPGRPRPLAPSIGYFGLRTGAPIVPIAFGGTHELYLGRRIRMEILPAVDARTLAMRGLPDGGMADEAEAAHAIAAAIEAMLIEPVADAHRATEPPTGRRKRWRWLTHAFR